jgi:phosphatidylserine/phosphatidylglycerophosphate/cardiolipin synthase-like enzyme
MTKSILYCDDYCDELIGLIAQAKKSVRCYMYIWLDYYKVPNVRSQKILNALAAAQHRGVRVAIITDFKKSQEFLKNIQFKCAVSPAKERMHAKAFIIDDKILVSGSHNMTKSSLHSNIELSTVLHDPDQLDIIVAEFDALYAKWSK